jgi:hypothetical protein
MLTVNIYILQCFSTDYNLKYYYLGLRWSDVWNLNKVTFTAADIRFNNVLVLNFSSFLSWRLMVVLLWHFLSFVFAVLGNTVYIVQLNAA